MAENPSGEKKHEATPRKLERVKDEGQVAIGKDIIMVGGLGAGLMSLIAGFSHFYQNLTEMVLFSATTLDEQDISALFELMSGPWTFVFAVSLSAMAGATLVTCLQTGGKFWVKLIFPDFKRIFKSGKLKRLVNGEMFSDVGLAVLKVVIIGGVAYLALRNHTVNLASHIHTFLPEQMRLIFSPLTGAAVIILATMTLLGGLEFALSRHRFLKKQKMTDEELKREQKNDDGDPLLNSQRKSRYREIVRTNLGVEVPKADVVVVNPVHVSVAIRYRPEEKEVPIVVAKGKGEMALKIRYLAHRSGIPIYEDVSLARMLYKRVKPGAEVPMDTYKAVAAVLAFVYRVTGRMPGAKRSA